MANPTILIACPYCGCSGMQELPNYSAGACSKQCSQCKKSFHIDYDKSQVTMVTK